VPTLPMRASTTATGSDDPRLAALEDDRVDAPDEDSNALCAQLKAIDPTLSKAGPTAAFVCDATAAAPTIDDASPGRLVASALADEDSGARGAVAAAAKLSHALLRADRPEDRAALRIVSAAYTHRAGELESACASTRAAVAEAPAVALGWLHLVTACEPTPAMLHATLAWFPDFPRTVVSASLPKVDAATALRLTRQLHAQAPASPIAIALLVRELAGQGHVEEAQTVASSLVALPHATSLQRALGQSLVQLARGRIQAAYDAILAELLAATSLDAPEWALGAWVATTSAQILGKSEASADAIVTRLDVPAMDQQRLGRESLARLATRSSTKVAAAFVERARTAGVAPIRLDADRRSLIEARAKSDRDATIAALRRLVLEGRASEPEAELLDELGADDLGGPLDEKLRDAAPTAVAGISPCLPRMARRAMRAGQRDAAKALAQKVIDAWSLADAPTPVVTEMRTIVAGTWTSKASW
ncbi:MAG: hypothetical protein ACHREM_07660, partial [Polyangiales bacterium]